MSSQPVNDNPLTALSDAMADAVARAAEYTVLVNARRRFPASGIGYGQDLVLTADHIVEREEDIQVVLPDGSEVSATVAGRDASTDLALLRLSRTGGKVADVALASGRVGQLVLAVGRPTSEGVQASLGIISSAGGPLRTRHGGVVERYYATDAIPYPGFSGGPLIDAAGRVLGVNTSGLAHGASLAIPADLAWQVASTLAQHGRIRRGYLGIRSQPVDLPAQAREVLKRAQATGLLLIGIEDDSPAATGGLMVGDILVGIGGLPVSDPDELFGRLSGSVVGNPTPVEILRGGQLVNVTVTIGERK